jgi:gamma-glutamylaminecyclotransferase
MELVFVYGTLKKNHGNHSLISSSRFIGKGHTRNKYALYEYGIPYVTQKQKESVIHGEVYSVSKYALLALDLLEQHPDWYYRQKTDILLYDVEEDKIKEVSAWLYFCDKIPFDAKINTTGTYKNYTTS